MATRFQKASFSTIRFLLTLMLTLGLAVGLVGCKDETKPQPIAGTPKVEQAPPSIKNKQDQQVLDLIENEDLVLDLSIVLSKFAGWFEAMSEGSIGADDVPFPTITECTSLAAGDIDSLFHSDPKMPEYISLAHWPIAESSEVQNPWQELLTWKLGPWETIKFGIVSADFANDDKTTFTMHTKAEGKAKETDPSAPRFAFKSHQDITWSKSGNEWVITEWKQLDFHVKKTECVLFEDVLAKVLGETTRTYKNAIRSYKDEMILELSTTGKLDLPREKYRPYVKVPSDYVFPGISVVDYDNDGDDDLFLTARWGPTQMFGNNGDGTFTEVTSECGLFFRYLVNCALFADFDNDGDQDVLIGRPLEPSVYMENQNGVFKNVTKTKSDIGKLAFVSGISVCDINRDGLLDAYVCTYPPLVDPRSGWASEYLDFKEAKKISTFHGRNLRIDRPGTANVMLMNRGGGRLERVEVDETISQWRSSLHSAWADIDADGDQDLYICNDFAPDSVLRNETPRGAADPVFVDVTKEVLLNKGIGFGMGASFSDFDQDGDFDLYVSNMFSKAGQRIIKKIEKVDPRVEAAAAGNFLYVNDGGKFAQMAGPDADKFHVDQVGWSYGGQWGDFDNDGWLDLYVPSGYFTAPKEVATEVDM